MNQSYNACLGYRWRCYQFTFAKQPFIGSLVKFRNSCYHERENKHTCSNYIHEHTFSSISLTYQFSFYLSFISIIVPIIFSFILSLFLYCFPLCLSSFHRFIHSKKGLLPRVILNYLDDDGDIIQQNRSPERKQTLRSSACKRTKKSWEKSPEKK